MDGALVIDKLFILVVLAVAVAGGHQTSPVRTPEWTRSFDVRRTAQGEPIERASLALEEHGRCVAVAIDGVVHVLDASGREAWQWNYKISSRFLNAGPMAIASSCDAVALVGDSGYRYTWIARRGRPPANVHTPNTPLGVAFDHKGQRVAIGTGGNEVVLATLSGVVQWDTKLPVCCVVRDLAFAPDDEAIVVKEWGAAVVRIDGTVAWATGASEMAAADDLRTFVASSAPNHGPGIGHVSVLDGRGEAIWTKFTSSIGAVISASGDRIVSRVNENQHPASENDDEARPPLQVLSRSGDVLATIPGDTVQTPLAIAPDGSRVLIRTSSGVREFDMRGAVTLEVPLSVDSDAMMDVSRDYRAMVIFENRTGASIRWFSLGRSDR